ncbi:MAG TPA: hypothetical protein VKU00_26970 [Chthonomonadaceae bacterium]|nr:hypothetical protein [Chthonomonadaceae bacterium]
MRNSQDADGPLSPGGLALLEAWIQAQSPPAEAEAPTLPMLVAYQSGMLDTDAVQAIESGLVWHRAARTLLRETRDALAAVRSMPWQEAAERAKSEDLIGQVARAWLALASAQVAEAPTARRLWQSEGLSTVRRRWEEGVAEARAAWTAFLSFGEQWRTATQWQPAAQVRGAEGNPHVVGTLPPGISLLAIAEIGPDGALRVTLSVRNASGAPDTALSGMTAHLALRYNQQNWPLASFRIEGDRAECILPNIGTALELPPGTLPADMLQITLGEEDAITDSLPLPLPAQVLDASGQPTDRRPALLQLWSLPHWEEGIFHLRIALPDAVRRSYADYHLQLDVVVAPRRSQRLGEWPVRAWGAEPLMLTAACPGSPTTTVAYAAILQARLHPIST